MTQQISEDAQRFFDSFMKELDLYMQYRDATDDETKLKLAKQIIDDDTITERDSTNEDEIDERIREKYDGLDRVHYMTQ